MTEEVSNDVEQELSTPTESDKSSHVNNQSDQYNDSKHDSEQSTKTKQFQPGDKLTFVRVRFPGNAKSFPFMIGNRPFQYGQKVIAPSDRGMALGYINSFPYEVEYDDSMLPLKYINKIATEEDIDADRQTYDKQKEAEVLAIELIEKFKLDMNLTHVEFTQFGKKTVFYFTAPNRVDFRSLVKELVSKLKTRIELRQISVRDRAASIGGIGSCGRQLCCSSFLQKYGSATIKMAKNQNMMLAGNKINGVCGQLKCCIQYEDEVYTFKRKNLPREGKFIRVKNGDKGKVLKLEILAENFTMLTDQGVKKRFAADQFNHKIGYLDENYNFPKRFDHISDETSQLITDIKEGERPHDSSMLDVFRQQADRDNKTDQNSSQNSIDNNQYKENKKQSSNDDTNKASRNQKNKKNASSRSHHSKRHSNNKNNRDGNKEQKRTLKRDNQNRRTSGKKASEATDGSKHRGSDKNKDFVYKRRS